MTLLQNTDTAWNEALDWFFLLQDNSHEPAIHKAFQVWLAARPEHARAWDRLQRTWQFTADAAVNSSPPPPVTTWKVKALSLAACVLLGCFLLFSISGAEYSTGTNEHQAIQLEDGSHVELAAKTQLNIDFSEHQRTANLHEGTAFFEIAPDSQRPFTIKNQHAHIQVLGTAFEVEARRTSLRVHVQQGQVAVTHAQLGTHHATKLKAGESLHISNQPPHSVASYVPADEVASWRKGKLIVKNTRVDAVIEKLKPYYSGVILLRDQQLAAHQVTGVFDLHNPQAALTALVEPYGGQTRQITPWVLVID